MKVEGWKKRSSERFGAVETFSILQGMQGYSAGQSITLDLLH